MKRISIFLLSAALLWGCGATRSLPTVSETAIDTSLDLAGVTGDRVLVSLDPGAFTSPQIRFYIPKTVPGTYKNNDYGQFVEDLVAYDYKGVPLEVEREGPNTWFFPDAKNLDRITYYVNDTYDSEGEDGNTVFSPAGTNILAGRHFMLNLHGFVGYFEGFQEVPYEISLNPPDALRPYTSLPSLSTAGDGYTFRAGRYFEVTDNPIQVTGQEAATIDLEDIVVNLSIYSPTGQYRAADLRPSMEKMMRAQKAFLGEIDGTSEYNILLYLSGIQDDASGFGALEHHTSTVVVLPELMSKEMLEQQMVDVVSHEFFHIVTPLNVHSEEIQYFDYNQPKMSQHLWMYEGTTEYFANLFQIKEGLIDAPDFYRRMTDKILYSQTYDDTMPFTEMSSHVLEEPYSDQYANVYQKGALINMALDIRLRELSGGAMGVLDLMKKLSRKYDKDTPFRDEALFDIIVENTYPEIREFFETYVSGTTPIDYNLFLEKVGLGLMGTEVECTFLFHERDPFINVTPDQQQIYVRDDIPLNSAMQELGLEPGDILKKVNGREVNMESVQDIFMMSISWTPETDLEFLVERDGQELILKGTMGVPTVQKYGIVPLEDPNKDQLRLREAWLKS
ncbi:MAG: peptidase M61 [Robiginitalea sp.]